jgi:hypothetical protein
MYNNFSSLPPHEEQAFIVYEQRTAEAGSKAVTFGAIAGAIVLVIAVGIYLGIEPRHIDYTKDMNMSNLTKKDSTPDPAPTPAPSTTPAPATTPAPTTTPGTTPATGSGTAPAPATGSAAPATGTAPTTTPATGSAAPAEAPAPK